MKINENTISDWSYTDSKIIFPTYPYAAEVECPELPPIIKELGKGGGMWRGFICKNNETKKSEIMFSGMAPDGGEPVDQYLGSINFAARRTVEIPEESIPEIIEYIKQVNAKIKCDFEIKVSEALKNTPLKGSVEEVKEAEKIRKESIEEMMIVEYISGVGRVSQFLQHEMYPLFESKYRNFGELLLLYLKEHKAYKSSNDDDMNYMTKFWNSFNTKYPVIDIKKCVELSKKTSAREAQTERDQEIEQMRKDFRDTIFSINDAKWWISAHKDSTYRTPISAVLQKMILPDEMAPTKISEIEW